MSPDSVDVRVEVESGKFAGDDDRWASQVSELFVDLRESVGSVRIDRSVVPGKKGGAEALILALGSAGAITAAVDLFKAWLARDRSRRVKLTIGDVQLEGEDITADALVKIIDKLR